MRRCGRRSGWRLSDVMIRDGILVLNKPGDWTSHDCVAVCRRAFRLKGVKKIGHGGTLDPMAEGVLPIFIGQATRIMEYLELDDKTYSCQMQLGITTDTQDIWGQELERKPFDGVTEEQIRRELEDFRGIITQMPPIYSAVRVEGRHLYDYARKGNGNQDILDRVQPRKVYIKELDIDEIDLREGRIRFHVTCSKGTYIRTICEDLGKRLGCGGTMSALTRTSIGSIDLRRSVAPGVIKAMDDRPDEELDELLLPADRVLTHFGRAVMPMDRAVYFRQGNSIRLRQIRMLSEPSVEPDPLTGEIPCNARGRRYDRIYRIYQEDGLFIGTGFMDTQRQEMRADKVFAPLNTPKKQREKTDEDI